MGANHPLLRIIPDHFQLKKSAQILTLFYQTPDFIWINPSKQIITNNNNINGFRSKSHLIICNTVRQIIEITSSKPEKTFRIIITEDLGSFTFMQLESIFNVNHIYVYGTNLVQLQKLKNTFSKIKIISNSQEEFEQKILEYHAIDNKERKKCRFIRTNLNEAALNRFQLNIPKFIKLEDKSQAKKDFISLAKFIRKSQLPAIQDFQRNYPNNLDYATTIRWFTKHNFYENLLNTIIKASYDINQVGYIRLPFHDMFHTIKQLYLKQQKKQLLVYKAIKLDDQQLNLIQTNIGKTIQITQFMTATKNKSQTQVVMNKNAIFIINISRQNLQYNNQYGFGDISTLGISDQQQIIFNPLNKFQVEKIQKFNKIKKIYLKYGSIPTIQRKMSSDFKIRKSKKQDQRKNSLVLQQKSDSSFLSPLKKTDSVIKIVGRQDYNTTNLINENSSSKQLFNQINSKSNSKEDLIRIQNRDSESPGQQTWNNRQELLKMLGPEDQNDKIIQQQIIKQGINDDETENDTQNKQNKSNLFQQKNKFNTLTTTTPIKNSPRHEKQQNEQKIPFDQKYQILKSKIIEKGDFKTPKQHKSAQISTTYEFQRASYTKSKQTKKRKPEQEEQKSIDFSPEKKSSEKKQPKFQDYFMLNKIFEIHNRLSVYNRFIWVDSHINIAQNRANINSFKQFYQVNPIESIKQAIEFINKYPNDNFCIISSSGMAEQICKEFKDNKNIIHIYIFTTNLEKGQVLKSKNQKVKAICTTLNELLAKITKQIKFKTSKISPRFIRMNKDKNNEYALYNLYGLLTMVNSKKAKQDFIKIASYLYSQQQNAINKFTNQYKLNESPETVIEWYLSTNFFRKILDILLRYSSDILELGYIRFPFTHLTNSIKYLYENQKNQQANFQFYRGDRLSDTEIKFLKQNTGKLIKLLGFLTACKTKKKAEKFFKNTLIIIKVNGRNKRDVDFGYVDSSKYKIPSQQEIIFNSFNIFKIQKVETASNGFSTVILKYGQLGQLKNQNIGKLNQDEQIEINNYKQLEKSIKKNIRNEGDVLFQCQRYDQAIKYKKKLFQKYKILGVTETVDIGQLFNEIGIGYKFKGDLDKALDYFDQSLKIFKKTVGKQHQYTAITYNNIADIFKQKLILDNSLKYYLKSIKSYQNSTGINKSFIANCYSNIAGIYNAKNQFDKAIEFYQKSLIQLQEKMNGKQNAEIAQCLINIGLAYRSKGDLYECLEYMFQALKVRLLVFGENHKSTVIIYIKIAQIYKKAGQTDKSLEYYLTSLEIATKIYGKNHKQIAKLYNQIGLLHRQKKDIDKSLEAQNQSLQIYTKLFGKNHVQTATVYNNIGQIYRQKQQYTKSLEYLADASKIFCDTIGQITEINATTYNNIGSVYYAKGDFDNAYEYFYRSFKIRKVLLGQKNADTATSYNNIGEAYRSKGQYDKAIQCFTKSLNIRLKVLGQQNIQTAISYNNLAQTYRSKQQLDKSLQNYHKALTILKTTYGPKHQTILQSYNNIGLIWREKGLLDKALKYQLKSFQLRIHTYGLNHFSNATSYNNIGVIYFLKGQYDKALQNYQNCLRFQMDSYGENHSSIATSYNNIGQIYKEKKQYNKALEYYHKSLNIAKTNYGQNHILTATCYNNIGSIYYLKKQLDKGLQFYTKSFNIEKNKFGENHSSTATSYSNIGLIYKQKGEKQKALQFFQKSLKIYLNIFGENHRATATIYFNLGNLFRSSQNYSKTFENYKKCYQIRKKILGQNHSDTKITFALMKQAQRLK